MNISPIIALVGLVFAAPVHQDTPKISGPTAKPKATISPLYKVGDQDNYKLEMSLSGPSSATMSANLNHKVAKVYPNGDADVTETVTDMKSEGQTPPNPGGPADIKLNSFGVFQGKMPSSPMTWAAYSMFLPSVTDLSSDKEWPVESDFGGAKLHATAKATDRDGDLTEYTLAGKLDVGGMAGDVKGSFVWNAKAHRYNKGRFTIVLTPPGGPGQMTMAMGFERIVSDSGK